MSHVTYHVSQVTCHMSCVTCHRVCYQRGLPRLVFPKQAQLMIKVLKYLTFFVTPSIQNHFMIGLKVTAILRSGLQMNGFCLVVEFHLGGSATSEATPSS